MSDIVSVVVFSPESAVRDALREALEEKLRPSLALEAVQTLSRAVDRILSRRPTMAFIDISGETEEALRTALSLHAGSPETRLIGLYNPLQIPGHVVLSELFLEAMRSGFFDFLRAPISPSELERILARVQDPASLPAAASGAVPGDVISLISSKGGVGKTAIAVNLAVALAAQAPGQVALVDASFDLGNTREFLGMAPEYTFYDAYLQRDRLDRDMLLGVMARHEPSGIFLLDSPRKVEEMVGIKDEGVTQVMLSLRKAFRYVIVDTIPVLTPVLLAIGDLSQSMLVVTEGVVPALKGTHALLAILEEAGYDAKKIKIILNRYSRSEGNVELKLAAQGLDRPIDYVLPYDKRLHEAANEGIPYLSKHPGSDFGLRIARIARDLTGVSPAGAPSSFFQRLLAR
jgi:pilus assembly protein CpaE